MFNDADVSSAAKILLGAKYRNAGQVCIAPTRLLVQDQVYKEFVSKFAEGAKAIKTGNGLDADSKMGSLANTRRVPAIEGFVQDALAKGGKLEAGGHRIGNKGYFFEPTVVSDVPKDARAMLTNWSRSSGDWGTSFAPKIKTNIVPTAIGRLGFSAMAGGTFDAMTGENTSMNVAIPATLRLSETMRIDINGGWLWDRVLDRHYLTYGVGFDWKFTDLLQLTLEAFGQAGAPDIPSATWPRFQAGIRYRPNEIFSFDVIYGRNITGENSNWITIGSTVRFPVPSK